TDPVFSSVRCSKDLTPAKCPTHRTSGVRVGKRNSEKVVRDSARLRKPAVSAVCSSENGASFTNSRPVICICEQNCPQILCCAAGLNGPAVSAVCSPDDR